MGSGMQKRFCTVRINTGGGTSAPDRCPCPLPAAEPLLYRFRDIVRRV